MKIYSGCQKAPIKFFPWGVSIAVLPPTLESTMARRVVGIWTKRTPRMLSVQRRSIERKLEGILERSTERKLGGILLTR